MTELAKQTGSTIIPGMRKRRHVEMNCATSDADMLDLGLMEALAAHRWDREPTAWSQ